MALALKRGLKVLDILARKREPLSFSQIKTAMGGMGHASLSRLLRTLSESGYIYKEHDRGLYSCGYKMAVFTNLATKGRGDYLIRQYGSFMQDVTEKFDVTCILLERVRDTLINIHKTQTRNSVHMQELGYINDQLDQPWMQLLASQDTKVEGFYKTPRLRQEISAIRARGYGYSDATLRPKFKRLGFPVFKDEEMIGALGLGGTILQITDKNMETLVRYVQKRMKALSEK